MRAFGCAVAAVRVGVVAVRVLSVGGRVHLGVAPVRRRRATRAGGGVRGHAVVVGMAAVHGVLRAMRARTERRDVGGGGCGRVSHEEFGRKSSAFRERGTVTRERK